MQRHRFAAILMATVCAASAASAQTAFIDQQGTRNDATIDQGDASGASEAEITQRGLENRTAVQQDGVDQAAFIDIDGDANNTGGTLEVQAAGDGRIALPEGDVVQAGRANTARVAVNGNDNAFAIDQVGRGNQAYVQQGLPSFRTRAMGSEPGAEAAVLEAFASSGNSALQVQRGTGNAAYALQVGRDNAARSYQSGRDNTVVQAQIGSDNFSSVAQVNDNNTLYHMQFGNGLSSGAADASGDGIQIRQFGGATAVVTQTGG